MKAKTVSYTTAGQSGLHLQSLLEKFGIAEAVKAKSKTLPSGDVAEFVARGNRKWLSNSFRRSGQSMAPITWDRFRLKSSPTSS